MRVALADDSTLFRNGLKALLQEVDVDVVFEARTADELLVGLPRADVDAVITDIRMPPTRTDEGVRAAIDIKQRTPGVGVLILSQYEDPVYAMTLLDLGLDGFGYLLKDRVDDVDVLIDALRRVNNQENVIDSTIVTQLLRRQRKGPLDDLTERESSVPHQMAEGRSNVGIGQALSLSPRTVEAHVKMIFTKLGLFSGDADNRRVLAVLTWLRRPTH